MEEDKHAVAEDGEIIFTNDSELAPQEKGEDVLKEFSDNAVIDDSEHAVTKDCNDALTEVGELPLTRYGDNALSNDGEHGLQDRRAKKNRVYSG